MPLRLLYITNDTEVATVAQDAGVDVIFVDLEIKGKVERQANRNTVISGHTVGDAARVKSVLDRSKLLVRVNAISHESQAEIDAVVEAGADIVMLPMFKTVGEVELFIDAVAGRAETCLLLETAEAAENLDSILAIPGIDNFHIGLNDLHLSYGMKFMFELLADGTVESLGSRIMAKGIPFGFGGIAKLGGGMLPAEYVITEHYRVGSTQAILARSFCDASKVDKACLPLEFSAGLAEFRAFEAKAAGSSKEEFEHNRLELQRLVAQIVAGKQ